MNNLFRNIGLLILLLLAGRMAAQVPVLDSVCSGAERHYRVDYEAGSTYSWILTPLVGPAIILPSDADTVEITWTYPAGIYQLGSVQHSLNGCDADTVNGLIHIFESPMVDPGPDDLVCIGWYYKLVNATADYYSSLLWTTSGDGTFDYDTILVATYTPGTNDIIAGVVTLTLTGFGQGFADACPPSVSSMLLSIDSEIVPQFEPIGPLCQFKVPPALPDTSLQGMTGTWDPAVISTLILGTFDYTFYPNDPAQCGVDTTIQITITDQIIPQFEPIGPLCINIAPPALPDTSLEGITGTWEPPVINTDVPGTFTYIFTPGEPSPQCGVVTPMDITVVTHISPLFDPIGPLCQYDTPPALPATSTNYITGTWQPPVISTDVPGTFDYIFTPDPDQCGTDTTIQIVIIEQVPPEFDPIPDLCQYIAAPVLPNTSNNDISGTWNPAWISTAVPGTFTFTFTPDPDECSIPYITQVTVIEEIVPQFEPIGPLCQYFPAPDLPLISLNGITGTWTPPVIITDNIGMFFYTFQPDPSFECTRDTTLIIYILPETIPTFTPIPPQCQNSVPPALPGTSLEGISGTWDPAVINTTFVGTTIYTFTPYDGQCALTATMPVQVTDEIIPEFDPIGPLCQNLPAPLLPAISNNNITGTWDPPVIDTSVSGTFMFTFSPDDPTQCGTEYEMEITVTDQITPEFDPIDPLCQYDTPPALPATSENNITGTWQPPVISTDVPGTFDYIFTPDPDQCGTDTTIQIVIIEQVPPEFDPIGQLCQGTEPPDLQDVSNNGINGSWNPLNINTSDVGTFTYTFTPDDPEDCSVPVSMDITIIPASVPVFTPIGPLCQQGPTVVLPGVSLDDITGTWDPPVVSTGVPGTFTFTFEPDDGQCAQTAQMVIEILEMVTPLFDQIGPLSQNTIAPLLPVSSNNIPAITGTWDPPIIDTSIPGTYPYTFTPDPGQCATEAYMNITVLFDYLHAITGPGRHCLGDAAIVPLEVDKFNSVASFQLKLSYNVDKLNCEGFSNKHPQLATNLTGWIDQVGGVITIIWQDVNPVTFNQQEKVCDLVFTPKEAGLGQLAWYTGATESFFHDPAGAPIPAEFFTEELTIYNPPSIILLESKTVCEGENYSMIGIASSNYPPISYLWTYPNGDTSSVEPSFSSVTHADAGIYTLSATDAMGCSDLKAIQLIVSDNPVADFHGSDTLIVPMDYSLEAGTGMASYLWNTGETSESIVISSDGMYSVEMISSVECRGIDSVYVIVLNEEIPKECIYVPNAFTPNGDGLNDTFKPVFACPISFYRMEIFNRWGEILFESSELSNGWDGKYHEKLCPGDGYVYKIVYLTEGAPETSEEMVKVGMVVIIDN